MTKSYLQEQIINTEESVHAGDHEAEQRLPSMQFTFTSDLEASLDTMSRLHLNLLWFLSSPSLPLKIQIWVEIPLKTEIPVEESST